VGEGLVRRVGRLAWGSDFFFEGAGELQMRGWAGGGGGGGGERSLGSEDSVCSGREGLPGWKAEGGCPHMWTAEPRALSSHEPTQADAILGLMKTLGSCTAAALHFAGGCFGDRERYQTVIARASGIGGCAINCRAAIHAETLGRHFASGG